MRRPRGKGRQRSSVVRVRDAMADFVETVRVRATVKEAAGRMRAFGLGALPVVDGELLVGILTDRDIAVRGTAAGRPAASTAVGEVMSSDVITCRPDQDLEVAARVMQVNQIRRLPVVDEEGRLVGILSLSDVARAMPEDLVGRVLAGIVQPVHALHTFP